MVSDGERECSQPLPSVPFEIGIRLLSNNKKKTCFPFLASPNPSTMVLNEFDPYKANLVSLWSTGPPRERFSSGHGTAADTSGRVAGVPPVQNWGCSFLLGLIIFSIGSYFGTDNFYFFTPAHRCSPLYHVTHFLRKRIYTRHLALSLAPALQ